MPYAKVAMGLAVNDPFDYFIPNDLRGRIKPGMRVWIDLRSQKIIGYVVELSQKTEVSKVKPVLGLIDQEPILDKDFLFLSRKLSDYYCCSWGQAIETMLPEKLRQGKIVKLAPEDKLQGRNHKPKATFIWNSDIKARWDLYLQQARESIKNNRGVIILLPDIGYLLRAKSIIISELGINPGVLYREDPEELEEWLKVKNGQSKLILGTRSAVFAPFNNLGLMIIEEESDSAYKQDQVPHYQAQEIAFLRMSREKARLLLGASAPRVEIFYLAKRKKIEILRFPTPQNYPKIELVDLRRLPFVERKKKIVISPYLQEAILAALTAKGKVLLFWNRKGFATFASCNNCGVILKCPRCNVNLVYHFAEANLSCHYCNYKNEAPKICPECNSGYIRYSGAGIEKIESEISRLFPQAKTDTLDSQKKLDLASADIFIATQKIIKVEDFKFTLLGLISADSLLQRADFRAQEKTFLLLASLISLSRERTVIQTRLTKHPCFKALLNRNPDFFYQEELKQRRQLDFPPFSHFSLIKLRGKTEIRVKDAGWQLFERLKEDAPANKIKVISLNPGQPAKLRGNFYWQICLSAKDVYKLCEFIKINLKNFRHSGIIVTVDVDPL